MPKLPPIKPKRLLGILLKQGFFIHHQTGSHVQLRHIRETNLHVTIPRHDKFDLPPSVVASILKQAQITRDDFFKLLQ